MVAYKKLLSLRGSDSEDDAEVKGTRKYERLICSSAALPLPSFLTFYFRVRAFSTGHFLVPPGLCIKTRLSAQPLIGKRFFMQVKLIFTRKVVHLATFWKWGFSELGSGLFPDYPGQPGADLRGSKYSDLTRKSLEFELVNSLSVITYLVLTNKLKDIPFIWVF